MELPFTTLDVFTRTRFRGNPLAVVLIPASVTSAITQDQKQRIAREFNLSETVFVHDVLDPAATTTRRVDIFLPYTEIPFAGHPVIGAAVSLLGQGVTALTTRAGPVAVAQTAADAVRVDVPHNLCLHARRLRDVAGLEVAALSTNPDIRARELDAPVFSIVRGMNFILIELPSLEMLAEASIAAKPLPPAAELLDDGWQQGFIGRLFYVRMGSSSSDDGAGAGDQPPTVTLRTRMMETSFEDPATGSASCCLSTFLSQEVDKQTAPLRRYEITQGVEMGRESNIVVEVGVEDARVSHVSLAGCAVQVMRGHVTV